MPAKLTAANDGGPVSAVVIDLSFGQLAAITAVVLGMAFLIASFCVPPERQRDRRLLSVIALGFVMIALGTVWI